LIRWFLPILHPLPRLHRHGLGDRLVANRATTTPAV
jgi:hypothetical protein